MRRKPTLQLTQTTAHTAEVRGRHALLALDRAGCPRQFLYAPPSGLEPCWAIPAAAIGDVAAAAESLGGNALVDVVLGAA